MHVKSNVTWVKKGTEMAALNSPPRVAKAGCVDMSLRRWRQSKNLADEG